MGNLARLGPVDSRARAPLYYRRWHEYPRMDIPQHRPWSRPKYPVPLFNLRGAGLLDKRKSDHRGRHVQLLPLLWPIDRRCNW